MSRTNNL